MLYYSPRVQNGCDFGLTDLRNQRIEVELTKNFAVILSLLQNQSRLRTLQAQQFEQRSVILVQHAPLFVVVLEIFFIGDTGTPFASLYRRHL